MKKYLSIILTALVITGSSCKKDYLGELTNNPNTPSVAAPNLLLSGALKTTAGILNGATSTSNRSYYIQYCVWVGYLSRSTGYQVFSNIDQYQFTTGDFDVWSPLYNNLSNYNAIIGSNSGANYTAIAKIMTVVGFQQLVDNYNNVPYSQALQGTKNLTPAFDTGSAIYDDLLKQLDASIALIKGATAADLNPGVADIMFKGDMTKWKKFANTLKLRIALRQSNIAAKTTALKAAVAATAAEGYLDATVDARVNPGYISSDAQGGQQSPLYLNYGYTQGGAGQTNNQQYQANQYSILFFRNNNDPRLKQVYAPNPNGDVIGSAFGGTVTIPGQQTPSKFGPGVIKSATMPAVIMSSAEALFLQAEGAAAGYITGNAATLYNAGITASFVDDGLTAAQATTYYGQTAIAYPAAGSFAAQQKAIIVQKWAALEGYGSLEAFNELRRTGYPDDIPLSIYPGVTAPNQVTRIFYPVVVYSTNATNVGAQGTIDKFNSKIFWAK
ncbi:SusD/RagB family nutrient-binding outer membrane lipoprotein [Mucilaginibacter sp. HC2]|uniref:SusD/RagB family nutrient-binding outer membrane lipoprotein n=1 Tax=Mucilaginibacter inviolabilis TaxID=2714892 RepID=UPI00140AF398|nr:SusD/RagB family nutrient-binding outer membrane lipoprotein [Mucilaginibacter inviolabilis]NHA07731.1 SusD/RagB family nutrient-binding outer membrane lipoprotein [Mucilaginibacter inviolabilis]